MLNRRRFFVNAGAAAALAVAAQFAGTAQA